MNSTVIPWTIEVGPIQTRARIGIWDHERELQPLRVSLTLRGIAPAIPQSIADCLDYQPLCRWIGEQWPLQPHTPLLETKLRELLGFVFAHDPRIEWVDAAIAKTAAFDHVASVGVRLALTRADFEAVFGEQTGAAERVPCLPHPAEPIPLAAWPGAPR